ncbi:MAG: hypothetical protein JXQ72_11005 [Anaerolineae bacterium]|nr:hypothetical protein [Anaerolineae bacterium]
MSTERSLVFNGINAATGDYLLPPMPPQQLADLIQGEERDPVLLSELKWRYQQTQATTFALREGLDPKNLAEAGWGVIFAANADPKINAAIREALSELLELRKTQAGPYYREYISGDGYRRGESKNDFLVRHGAGPGPVDPERVPYYLLIVGDPQSIPYRFQYEMDVSYAVGRIHFGTLDEYAQYARSVVLAERGAVKLPRRAVFFGVSNPDDYATSLSTQFLIQPLARAMQEDQPSWSVQTVLKDEAKKARLGKLLGGGDTPALLFTGSHGMGFPNGDARQVSQQGALLCQEWPGPRNPRPVARDHYFAGEDIGSDASLLGMMTFHFACYGAGTPYWDDFSKLAFKERSAIAPHAFIAGLPQRLLGHPKGGALAVIGHIERAWTYSFSWDQAGMQTGAFESTLKRLVEGHPIGSAMDYMNSRYAEIATVLSNVLEEAEYTQPDPYNLANLWTANNDARGYAILGDPAVRLPVAEDTAPGVPRPVLTAVPHHAGKVPVVLVRDFAIETPPTEFPAVSPAGSESASASQDFDAAISDAATFDAASFGLLDGNAVRQVRDSLSDTLKRLANQLAIFMGDVTSLEVATYVSEAMQDVKFDSQKGEFTAGAVQRALTRINFDGDMKICVPMNADEVDQDVWNVHTAMVAQAQANRAAMIKTVADVLAGLLGVSGLK